jgi:hypothetical protein
MNKGTLGMRFAKNVVLTITVLALLGAVGCKKKKPNLPAQTQPPTVSQPEPEKPPAEPKPEEIPLTQPPVTETTPEPLPPAPKPKPHSRRKKPTPQPNAGTPTETKPGVAKPATTSKPADNKPSENVQISAEVPQNVANQRRQQTEDLLNTAETNLKKVTRSLTDGEQSMQRQVRNFITQSRLAVQDGDFERAYNLATKAQQLSQELVK